MFWSTGPRCWASVVAVRGLISCGLRALELWLSSCGAVLVVLQHVGSSWTRDRTSVPCIARWILNHWTTREAPEGVLRGWMYPELLRPLRCSQGTRQLAAAFPELVCISRKAVCILTQLSGLGQGSHCPKPGLLLGSGHPGNLRAFWLPQTSQ